MTEIDHKLTLYTSLSFSEREEERDTQPFSFYVELSFMNNFMKMFGISFFIVAILIGYRQNRLSLHLSLFLI